MFLVDNCKLLYYIRSMDLSRAKLVLVTNNLKTVKNYANKEKVTTSYIYKLIKEDRISPVTIDGVMFIDTTVYPSIQTITK